MMSYYTFNSAAVYWAGQMNSSRKGRYKELLWSTSSRWGAIDSRTMYSKCWYVGSFRQAVNELREYYDIRKAGRICLSQG
jgi:hypothetical protein